MSLLDVQDLAKSFGSLKVIDQFDLLVDAGARHAIIGPNGAGKTTLFNMISGWLPPDRGRIQVNGTDIAGQSPEQVARAGLARSFQKNTLFEALTVCESIRLAVQAHSPARFQVFRPAARFTDLLDQTHEIAQRMELGGVLDRTVRSLSYGQKRQLEVAMALAGDPRILLLDEPAAGTSPAERETLIRLLTTLPDDMALLLVEHDMDVVFGVCEVVTVLNYGRIVASGTPEQVRNDPDVRAAYLGEHTEVLAP